MKLFRIKTITFLCITIFVWLNYCNLQAAGAEELKMVFIKGGEFLRGMETSNPLGLVWATPQEKINVPSFQIDIHEVTNKEYKVFVDATGHRVPFDTRYDTMYNWENGTYNDNLDNHPVVLVDWYDAGAFCKWKGKRLPSEMEWEKAARGTDGRVWPWGNEFDKFASNTLEFGLGMTMPVGSFQKGKSPYGVMDMTGNVFEWTSDWFKGYPKSTYKRADYGEQYKVVRGGTWTAPANPYAITFSRSSQLREYKHRSLGFRCVKKP